VNKVLGRLKIGVKTSRCTISSYTVVMRNYILTVISHQCSPVYCSAGSTLGYKMTYGILAYQAKAFLAVDSLVLKSIQ